jgi:hypothetical protein
MSIERNRVNPHHPARVIIRVIAPTMLATFTLPLWVGTSAGVVTFLLSVGIQQRYQSGQWMRVERNLPVLFPSQPK